MIEFFITKSEHSTTRCVYLLFVYSSITKVPSRYPNEQCTYVHLTSRNSRNACGSLKTGGHGKEGPNNGTDSSENTVNL